MSLARFVAFSAAAAAIGGILAGATPALPLPAALSSSAALPTVTFVQQPPATTSALTATFAWTSQGAQTTTCALDSKPPAFACTSPFTLTGLSAGSHTLAVRVVNAIGSAHALATWTITAAQSPPSPPPPTVTILSGPPATTSASSASFSFSATNAPALTCSLDTGTPSACSTPMAYTAIAPGPHTFTVTATAGSLSTSTSYPWTITPPPPTVTILSGPPATTSASSASFSFSATNAPALTCSLDTGTPSACSTPMAYTAIAPGPHTFTVTATAGSLSTSTSYPWTITPPPPTVTILSGPPATTSASSASFSFSATNAPALTCSLDTGTPSACSTPMAYTAIAPGPHTFTVTATAGSLSTSTSYPWTITPVTVNGLAANIWIDTAGSDSGTACARSASRVGEPNGSTVCATAQQACKLAHGGDVIGVAGGTYAVGFNLTSCNPASPITFQNIPGTFVSFAPTSTITDSSNITLQGDVAGYGHGFSLAYTTIGGSSSNIIWNDVNLYCQAKSPYVVIHSTQTNETACNSALSLTGTLNGFTWNGGDQENWAVCLTSCTHSGISGNPNDDFVHPNVRNVLIEHVVFKNYYALDSSGIHSEEWFLDGGDYIEFLDDSITDCGPPASTGYAVNTSCNTAVVFVGQLSGTDVTTNHLSFIQDIIAGGHAGQKAFQSGYDYPAATEPTFTFEYDTFDGSLTVCGVSANKCGPGTQGALTGQNMTYVGNVGILSSVGCFASAAYSHDTWYMPAGYTTSCATTDSKNSNTASTHFWSSPGAASFGYTPLPPLQGAGDNAYCPATDIDGKARPAGTPCDAGAVQH